MAATTPQLGLNLIDTPAVDTVDQLRLSINNHASVLDGMAAAGAIGMPPGSLVATARATSPTGWLLCDGASLLRTAYPALFAAIGTGYGSVDGTHFNVPDLRGRVPVGVDGAANRLDANDALADAGGEEKHQLATADLPAHAHAVTDPGHGHQTGPNSNYWPPNNMPGSTVTGIGVGTANAGLAVVSNNTTGISIQNTGGGGAHNNMQPYQIVNWIIKT